MWVSQFVVVVMVVVVGCTAQKDPSAPLESDNIINTVNNAKTTWTAGKNFDPSFTMGYLSILLGAKKNPGGSVLPKNVTVKNMDLPTTFDARSKWSFCSGLQTVRDQGPCGSCWAVATAAAFTDRLCIASGGSWNSQLSSQYLLTCCSECGSGCLGGYPDDTWRYLQRIGDCTGGDYGSNVGCQPYTLPPCEHHVNSSRENCKNYNESYTPACSNTFYNNQYSTVLTNDFHRVSSTFSLDDVENAMKEIYTNGPITATFDAYEDLLSYQSGVYQHITGVFVGGHVVKVIGWGEENGTKYWLEANQWNNDWGDNGFLKFIRGTNDCGFEEYLSGGHPIV